MQTIMNLKVNWDGLGVMASLLCAIHCALLPVLLTSIPLFGINIIHNLLFEWVMIGIAAAVGTYSLYHGFIKHHQQYLPAVIFGLGIIFLMAKQIFHNYQLWLLIPAVVLIVTAHYLNYRLCHLSKCNSPHHKH
ncbi:MAG: MerC domain-containing protein [Ferruginibacter sp.]